MKKRIEPKTERLQLRQWREADCEPFAAINSDPQVMEFFPDTLSRVESDAGIDRQIAHIEKYGWGFWAVETLQKREFIGFVGIKNATDDLPFSPAVEIGWRLARLYWGRGYACEAARACLQVGFEQPGVDEIVSFTVPGNFRSRAVMERLGMTADEHTFQHPRLPQEHPMREHVLYRLRRPQ